MLRREFVTTLAVSAVAAAQRGQALESPTFLGGLKQEPGETPLPGASWYVASAEKDGLEWKFPAGTLASARYVTCDLLLDGGELVTWMIHLHETGPGRTFNFRFGALNQCSVRMRMPLALVDQNRWMIEREGAFLKPTAGGDRVDLDKVDRMRLTVIHKAPGAVRWCMTPLRFTPDDVPLLDRLVLPKGKLIDELGQSAIRDWPAKTRSAAELKSRLQGQLAAAPKQTWPEGFSRWGGAKQIKLGDGTGFFRTQKQDGRWWLVDPEGYAFWSAGCDCVRVDTDARVDGLESALAWLPPAEGEFKDGYGPSRAVRRRNGLGFNYLAANFIRAFGPQDWRRKWADIALAELRRLRFNTVGNWSEWEYAAAAKFPYVRPMNFSAKRSGLIYRDFPDVYHPGFDADTTEYASELVPTAQDPALIGYFLMNEPTWGFSTELPAAGMLYNTETCPAREELARVLRRKYDGDAALSAAWKLPASFDKLARGRWQGVLTPEALADLKAFSTGMVERYFRGLSAACKKAAPNHLNLGMRWAGVPPEWAVSGMKSFDVFSLNCYMEKLPRDRSARIHEMLAMPVMVGEWHFGALDVGLPASGIGHVKTQEDRGRAYRVYLEDAAANPYCVGVHWFTLYDQSALGRFDGENYNIGFLDICNRAYEPMAKAAVAAHERMYQVARGQAPPFADAPEYLPLLFL